ncbi:hypothetical protein HPB47_009460 [Ixodes persulcatus]|uniref:Uncharacterized protein n=1 Tax=Ixodes persulcatus TaxID=34615 RepID=A0AC60P235_IXOPE|nr:hypothetical protein HPB47_009460 [Ixodes persulcatus]
MPSGSRLQASREPVAATNLSFSAAVSRTGMKPDKVRPTVEVLPVSSINAFVDKAHETSRLLLEGEIVFEAGRVFSRSIKKLDKDRYTFIGFVLQTSALTSDLHELKIILNG